MPEESGCPAASACILHYASQQASKVFWFSGDLECRYIVLLTWLHVGTFSSTEPEQYRKDFANTTSLASVNWVARLHCFTFNGIIESEAVLSEGQLFFLN